MFEFWAQTSEPDQKSYWIFEINELSRYTDRFFQQKKKSISPFLWVEFWFCIENRGQIGHPIRSRYTTKKPLFRYFWFFKKISFTHFMNLNFGSQSQIWINNLIGYSKSMTQNLPTSILCYISIWTSNIDGTFHFRFERMKIFHSDKNSTLPNKDAAFSGPRSDFSVKSKSGTCFIRHSVYSVHWTKKRIMWLVVFGNW